jgi:hypothetical protein
MASGLRVWDNVGNLLIDTSTRMGRVLGQISTGTADGSVTSAGFATGAPFYAIVPKSGSPAAINTPNITITGNTMSWSFSGVPSPQDSLVLYGVY